MNVVSHCFPFLPVFLSSQEMPLTFLSMTEKHKWKSSDVQRRTPTWRFLFRSVTMTGLFGRSAWCEKLRSYALQSVRITLFAWVNPKSHMTRAACPVRMGRLGPENCYRRQQKKKKKQGEGRKPSTLCLSLNIDSEVCHCVQVRSTVIHTRTRWFQDKSSEMLLKLKLICHTLMNAQRG